MELRLLLLLGALAHTATAFSNDITGIVTDNDYPTVGETVHYEAQSEVVFTAFAWTVNDSTWSTSGTATVTFGSAGIYELCVFASAPGCEASYCQNVVVFDDGTDCSRPSFLFSYTAEDQGEASLAVYNYHPDTLLQVGYASRTGPDGQVSLTKISPRGEVYRSRKLARGFWATGAGTVRTHWGSDQNLIIGYRNVDSLFVLSYSPNSDHLNWEVAIDHSILGSVGGVYQITEIDADHYSLLMNGSNDNGVRCLMERTTGAIIACFEYDSPGDNEMSLYDEVYTETGLHVLSGALRNYLVNVVTFPTLILESAPGDGAQLLRYGMASDSLVGGEITFLSRTGTAC